MAVIYFLLLISLISINMSIERKKKKREVLRAIAKKQRIQKRNDILNGDYQKYLEETEKEKTIIQLIISKLKNIIS